MVLDPFSPFRILSCEGCEPRTWSWCFFRRFVGFGVKYRGLLNIVTISMWELDTLLIHLVITVAYSRGFFCN